MQQAIAYYRVSNARQGRSGLGIEAQREAVTRFAAAERFDLTAEFVEVETGKGNDALDRRPRLAAALATDARCRREACVAGGIAICDQSGAGLPPKPQVTPCY